MTMLAPTVDVGPVELDLRLYAGDGFSLGFTFELEDGTPWDASGAWAAQVRAPASSAVPFVTFTVDATAAATGLVSIALNGPQVRSLVGITGAWWDLQQTPAGGEPRTWYRGRISASQDVTRA